MSIIDFCEIPEAHLASGLQDTFREMERVKILATLPDGI